MHLNPYGTDAVQLAVTLTNGPPRSTAELTERCRCAGLVVDHPASRSDLATVRRLVSHWLAVVDADDAHERARLLNALLARWTAHPRLTDHAEGWHLHYRDDDLPLGRVVSALVATGTALHLAGRGISRLGRCAAQGCDRVYADVSRGGRQRYCSSRCANRDAVRRHRGRQRDSAQP